MNPQLWIWITLLSAALGAVFSALHQALRRVGRTALEAKAEPKGPRSMAAAQQILADPDGHALAVALPRTVLNLATLVFAILWVNTLTAGVQPTALDRVIALAFAAVLIWLIGAVGAHAMARHGAASLVLRLAPVARATYLLLRPVSPLVAFIDEVVRRLSGGADRNDDEQREAELLSMMEDREREGNIDETEREMIEAIVEFRTKTVEQIMTPRTEVLAREYTDDLHVVHEFLHNSGHSRIPVFRENLDHIEGVLYAKDLLNELARRVAEGKGNGHAFSLAKVLRDAEFVPETKTVRELLAELIAKKVHLAMVADEYGGTAGLITVEDILEEIVGEIQDEYETEADGEPAIELDIESKSAVIEARAYIDDVTDELKRLCAKAPTSEDYATLGGFVVVALGRIPEAGESFRHEELLITILEAEPTRVLRVKIEVGPSDEDESEPAARPIADEDPHEAGESSSAAEAAAEASPRR